ncbi:MAG TPA: hypothetical protein VHZ95_03725 [Polyangiales bacterium]|nr:hypothetical protein [Polyangiales bacterium]
MTNRSTRPLLIVLFAALGACESAAAAPLYPPRWSDQLGLAALSDIAQEFKKVDPDQFGDLTQGDVRTTPQSCEQWTDLHRRGYEAMSTVDAQGDGYALIRCGTLALLQKVQPAKRSCLRDLALDSKLLSRLPALVASAWSDDAVADVADATKHHRSLRAYDSDAHVLASKDKSELQIAEEPGQRVSILITPQAWGDFNRDDNDDLAISVINASEGTAAQARLLLLTCSTPKAVFTVLPSD